VRSPKKFNVRLYQKVPFVRACFQASAAPRQENPDSNEKDALFGLDTQITIYSLLIIVFNLFRNHSFVKFIIIINFVFIFHLQIEYIGTIL
jgi:hypothetical protein